MNLKGFEKEFQTKKLHLYKKFIEGKFMKLGSENNPILKKNILIGSTIIRCMNQLSRLFFFEETMKSKNAFSIYIKKFCDFGRTFYSG